MSSNRLDVLYNTHQKHEEEMKLLFFKDLELSKEGIEFLLSSTTSMMVGILSVWIKHRKKESVDGLLKEFKKSVSGIYHAFS